MRPYLLVPLVPLLAFVVTTLGACGGALAGPLEEGIALAARLDTVQASAALLPLAERGDVIAQRELGVMYMKVGNCSEALRWLRPAAEKSDTSAEYALGGLFVLGCGVERDFGEGVQWIRRAADQSCLMAQTRLGIMYEEGTCVAKDTASASIWLRRAADRGYVPAMFNLGLGYLTRGSGVRYSRAFANLIKPTYVVGTGDAGIVESLRWLRMAADQGLVGAQLCLGVLFDRGVKSHLGQLGGPGTQDLAAAELWYRAAAAQKDPEAMLRLGLMLKDDPSMLRGKQRKEGQQWLLTAAALDYAPAATQVGLSFCPEDAFRTQSAKKVLEAREWFRKAARLGDSDAMWYLSRTYQVGQADHDPVQAYVWMALAADHVGSDVSAPHQNFAGVWTGGGESYRAAFLAQRDAIGKKLKPEQKSEAERIIGEWRAEPAVRPARSLTWFQ